MGFHPTTHAAKLTQPTNPHNISNPNPKTTTTTTTKPQQQQQQPPPTKTQITAYFATHAATTTTLPPTASTAAADHARNVCVKAQSIPLFEQHFGMSAAQARMEVEREMGRRYGGNPWDEPGPGPRRMMEERREREMREERREREMREREREEEERRQRERAEEKTEPVYSASEWDHFERSLGYK